MALESKKSFTETLELTLAKVTLIFTRILTSIYNKMSQNIYSISSGGQIFRWFPMRT